ncbi:hypothetical protein PVW47_08275 [Marinovum sp. SP66]|uniref:hypothetical protein n=1 Tax=Marinovum TaxID=367771 RepID=UPI00237C16D2|nr:hypothetical protein [Marinovum sp. SP66]MDD9739769.1 hypothetical protein [Marinovum sp. SP66]
MVHTTEAEIATAVMRIAARSPDGTATFEQLYKEIPSEITLTADDQRQSTTRPNEQMWEQIVRNIQSHHEAEGNAIAEGWLVHVPKTGCQITDAGRKRI